MALKGEPALTAEFDRWLEDEFGKGYVSFIAALPPARAPYRAGGPATGRPQFTARLTARTVAVFAAVSFALMATSALAAGLVTGSADPQVWGQHVADAVATCKTQLANGQHGIGACVSAIARQKGTQEREQHPTGHGASTHPPSSAGPPSSVPSRLPSGIASGPPSGRPTGVPVGPPTVRPSSRP